MTIETHKTVTVECPTCQESVTSEVEDVETGRLVVIHFYTDPVSHLVVVDPMLT